MLYVDSCVFIAAFFKKDPNYEKANYFIKNIIKEKTKIITSGFGLAEIGGFISRNTDPELAAEFILNLCSLPNLHFWYSKNSEEMMHACTAVSVKRGLSGSDSIHLISAVSSESSELVTLDKDFKKVEDLIRVKIL